MYRKRLFVIMENNLNFSEIVHTFIKPITLSVINKLKLVIGKLFITPKSSISEKFIYSDEE